MWSVLCKTCRTLSDDFWYLVNVFSTIRKLGLLNCTELMFAKIKTKYRNKLVKQLNIRCGLVKHDVNSYAVHYEVRGKPYKIFFTKTVRRPKDPKVRAFVCDETNKEITDELYEWLGPYYDFHCKRITPKILGYSKIKVKSPIKNDLIFRENDEIFLT